MTSELISSNNNDQLFQNGYLNAEIGLTLSGTTQLVENNTPQEQKLQVAEVEENEEEEGSKHPLKYRWTLWIDVPKDNSQFKNDKNWQDSMQQLCTIGTVEDFWRLFNNVITPGSLKPRADLYFFKEFIKPDWEEPVNEEGGCWSLLVPKSAESKQLLDKWWMHMLMAVVGEQFDFSQEICGLCVHIRRGQDNMKNPDRVALWTRNAYAAEEQVAIGKHMKNVLEVTNEKIGYQSHKERAGKRPRDLYSV